MGIGGGFRDMADAWRHYAHCLELHGAAVAEADALMRLLKRTAADVEADAAALARARELQRILRDPRGLPPGAADKMQLELHRLREKHRELLGHL
jgi:hypothetical protein